MKKKFKFSVIIPIYNVEEYLEETIKSVINQSIGFKDNIELILINDGTPDNSEKICLKYKELYPDNIIYYKQENSGVSTARNKGIELATGELINFLDSDDKWSLNAFKIAYKAYKKHPEVNLFSCKMIFFDAQQGNHPLNYKYEKNKIVNVLEDYEYIQLSSSSIFITSKALANHKYDKNIKYSEDNKFINEIILDNPTIMMLKKPIYYYRKRANGQSAIQNQIANESWYIDTPNGVYKYLLELSKEKYGKVIKYIQQLIAYELNWRVALDENMPKNDKLKKEYSNILTELINNIEDDVILNHRHLDLAKVIFLLEFKNQKDYVKKIKYTSDKIYLDDLEIKVKGLGHLIIDQTYIRDNKIIFYGKLDTKFVAKNEFHVISDDKEIEVNYYDLTNDFDEQTFNNKRLHKYIGINFEIEYIKNVKVKFLKGENILAPRFKKNSILSEDLIRSYHHIKNRTILLKNNIIISKKRHIIISIIYELLNEIQLLIKGKYKSFVTRLFTKVYHLFKVKKIWIISDRLNKADDNGEHFFKYMIENHPKNKLYFLLSKKSPDYERISKLGKVLDPDSLKYKLLFQVSDYIVSSHAENYIFNVLGNSGRYVRDQYHFKYIFLQHGIIKDDLSPWLNVNTKTMNMFVTSSVPEYNSVLEYKYYYGKEVVKLTGLPRYDTLLEKKKTIKKQKSILVSFTWRNILASKVNSKTGERLYNPNFKKSDYFNYINDLINDKKLLKILKETGYKIKLCPHPNVLVQLEDFTTNDYVTIEKNNINYQKEFCENSLLVTDYSSVFFDFAYLHKPIVYFQPDREVFFEGQLYNEGYFDYEKMGFGPVCYDHNKLIEEIIKIIKKDCIIEKKYDKRINSFFKYHDNLNCERVYNEIINLKGE